MKILLPILFILSFNSYSDDCLDLHLLGENLSSKLEQEREYNKLYSEAYKLLFYLAEKKIGIINIISRKEKLYGKQAIVSEKVISLEINIARKSKRFEQLVALCESENCEAALNQEITDLTNAINESEKHLTSILKKHYRLQRKWAPYAKQIAMIEELEDKIFDSLEKILKLLDKDQTESIDHSLLQLKNAEKNCLTSIKKQYLIN